MLENIDTKLPPISSSEFLAIIGLMDKLLRLFGILLITICKTEIILKVQKSKKFLSTPIIKNKVIKQNIHFMT